MKRYRVDILFLAVLFVLSSVKFLLLDQGMAYFEPDPYSQAQLAARLASGETTMTGMGYWSLVFGLWLVLWAAVIRITQDAFVAGRLIAVTASIVITLTLYLYGRARFSRLVGWGMALVFALIPLGVFFARYPLSDMLLAMWGLLFFVFFDLAIARANWVYALAAGIFLFSTTATKITGIQFWFLPLVYTMIPLQHWEPRETRAQLRQVRQHFVVAKTLPIQLIPLVPALVAGALAAMIALPMLITMARADPTGTAWNLLRVLKVFASTSNISNAPSNLMAYFTSLPYWLSSSITILWLAGLIIGIRRWGNRTYAALTLQFFMALALLTNVWSPRYFVQILTMIAITAGWGMAWLVEWLAARVSVLRSARAGVVVTIVLILTAFPAAWHAYESTFKYKWLDQIHQVIRRANLSKESWVLTSYWPDSVADYDRIGLESTLLTTDPTDANLFYPYWKHQRAGFSFKESPLQVLIRDGGAAVVEDAYSRRILSNAWRREAIDYIQSNYQPVLTIEDPSPNFPYSPAGNRVWVYIIPAQSGSAK